MSVTAAIPVTGNEAQSTACLIQPVVEGRPTVIEAKELNTQTKTHFEDKRCRANEEAGLATASRSWRFHTAAWFKDISMFSKWEHLELKGELKGVVTFMPESAADRQQHRPFYLLNGF